MRLFKDEISTYGFAQNKVVTCYDYLGLQSSDQEIWCQCVCAEFVETMMKAGLRITAMAAMKKCLIECAKDPEFKPDATLLFTPPELPPTWNFDKPASNWKTVLDGLLAIGETIKDKLKR